MPDFNLQTYLRLVALEGKVKIEDPPTLDLLKLLVKHHVKYVPYQNLDLLRVRGTNDMTPSSLLQRLLVEKRGGYCFEMSDLMFNVLLEFKFDAKRIVSHSLGFFEPAGPIDNHAMVVVRLDGKMYLVDVGNAFASIRDPLELDFERPQETSCLPFEKYRLELFEDRYVLNLWVKNTWAPLYRFSRPLIYLDEGTYIKIHDDCMYFPGHLPIRDSVLVVAIMTDSGRVGYRCDYDSEHQRFSKPYKKYSVGDDGKWNTEHLDFVQFRDEISSLVNVPLVDDKFEKP